MCIFVGVDIAGQKNTWIVALDSNKTLVQRPVIMTLEEIVNFCLEKQVNSITIDAPLSYAINENDGLRDCDDQLRDWLGSNGFPRQYVLPSNCLQAVPSRGRQLAEELHLRDFKILETVPRFCLAQMATSSNNANLIQAVKDYKGSNAVIAQNAQKSLWDSWWTSILNVTNPPSETFNENNHDGKVDALVCATIGYLFSEEEEKEKNSRIRLELKAHNPQNKAPIRGFVNGIHVLDDRSISCSYHGQFSPIKNNNRRNKS